MPAASLPPSHASHDPPSAPSSFTQDQMFAVISRLDNSLAEIARAVKPLGSRPRPDPDPPYSRPLSGPLAITTFQTGATWSTTTSTPPPQPGFHLPPPPSTGYRLSDTSIGHQPTLPSGPHYCPPNPNPSTASQNPNSSQQVSWNPTVTSNYGPPFTQQSSWDIPSSHPTPDLPHSHRASCWDHPDSRHNTPTTKQDPCRYMKMDPPRFDGTDVTNWISRVQYYFDHIQLPVDHRPHYVIMLFDPPRRGMGFYLPERQHVHPVE